MDQEAHSPGLNMQVPAGALGALGGAAESKGCPLHKAGLAFC